MRSTHGSAKKNGSFCRKFGKFFPNLHSQFRKDARVAKIAQSVEHFIRNEKVPGSSPGRGSGKEIQLTFQIVESLFFLYKSLEIIIYSFYD